MYKLSFLLGNRPSHWLIDDVTQLGSHMRNQLMIDEKDVRPFHAVVEKESADEFYIRPFDQECLVSVNGNVIKGKHLLQTEDVVSIASQELRFVDVRARKSVFSAPKIESVPVIWKLTGIAPEVNQGKTYEIQESLSIGRDDNADVRIAERNVSRMHAIFMVRFHQLWVKDLNSSNGTFVSDKRIKEKELKIGDEISISNWVFTVSDGVKEGEHIPLSVKDADATIFQPVVSSMQNSRDLVRERPKYVPKNVNHLLSNPDLVRDSDIAKQGSSDGDNTGYIAMERAATTRAARLQQSNSNQNRTGQLLVIALVVLIAVLITATVLFL